MTRRCKSVIDLDQPATPGAEKPRISDCGAAVHTARKRILLLGTAGGSLVHFLRHYLPTPRFTAVDIDTELIEKMLELDILPSRRKRI